MSFRRKPRAVRASYMETLLILFEQPGALIVVLFASPEVF